MLHTWWIKTASKTKQMHVCYICPTNTYIQITYKSYMTLLSVSDSSKNKRKQAKRSKVTQSQGFGWQNNNRSEKVVKSNPSERDLTHSLSVCGEGGGRYVVKGLSLNGMAMISSDLFDASSAPYLQRFPCCGSLIHLPQLQATSAGIMGFVCRGLLLQMPLWLIFSVSAFTTTWPGSSVVCHNGLAPSTFTNTNLNNSILKT